MDVAFRALDTDTEVALKRSKLQGKIYSVDLDILKLASTGLGQTGRGSPTGDLSRLRGGIARSSSVGHILV